MATHAQLSAAVTQTGYYPALVLDALEVALAGESVVSFVLQHETAFDRDELHRHLTVVVLTPSRVIVSHTDEHGPDAAISYARATTSTEAVALSAVVSVVVQKVVSAPADYGSSASQTEEVGVTLGWGSVSRIDLGAARCEDPQCEADHGFSGTSVNDDLQIRVSRAADGEQRIAEAVHFAGAISVATSTLHQTR